MLVTGGNGVSVFQNATILRILRVLRCRTACQSITTPIKAHRCLLELMLCYALLCFAMLCYALLCFALKS